MTDSYDDYCDHCCEHFTSSDVASRHLHEMEVHVNVSLGFEDFILEIKRDPELSVFKCAWSSCGAVFCDSDTIKRHVLYCPSRPDGLGPAKR
ncbi:uncharacterized protein FA14DRAFT_178178 [Meira miltonrushii]|uniref:C2H2-type domain-containing protein n=1 Tax=Meira miltonrushii TaxID=1280837 RepID=A0A316VFK9_9BASI|nr:uncharacterized protein FA14DRAFT_178178 [Meira miltonrushii]PWN34781.1 hypothetical protein FA14DRAFT_178178 [Meira miltonrushii]